MSKPDNPAETIAVVGATDVEHTFELLGDARELADRRRSALVVLVTQEHECHFPALTEHGADEVWVGRATMMGPNQKLALVESFWNATRPFVTFVSRAGPDRALAARLAARLNIPLITSCFLIKAHAQGLRVTVVEENQGRAMQQEISDRDSLILTMRPGVPQSRPADSQRRGCLKSISVPNVAEPIQVMAVQPADPASTDIVHLPRLFAGGRGLGGREGFDFLRQVAQRFDAGVAASRMAVDLGWVERERQVGQTGRTVSPELYVACGISGASHHRDGMSSSRHIVAINSDETAPIFQLAHLGLVSDWRETLDQLCRLVGPTKNEKG